MTLFNESNLKKRSNLTLFLVFLVLKCTILVYYRDCQVICRIYSIKHNFIKVQRYRCELFICLLLTRERLFWSPSISVFKPEIFPYSDLEYLRIQTWNIFVFKSEIFPYSDLEYFHIQTWNISVFKPGIFPYSNLE